MLSRIPHRVPRRPTPRPVRRASSPLLLPLPLLFRFFLCLGLLPALFPCYGGAAGHTPTTALPSAATPSAASSVPSTPPLSSAQPVPSAPSDRPVPVPMAAASGEPSPGHDATTCVRGVPGGLPQGRSPADPQGAGAELLGGALLGVPVPWPGGRSTGARRGRAGSGRSVLAALCRCRI
ncbi:hypothetical protein ACFY12_19995 [Streptomyces sp. NPDC001339]|uniref:hypothetical protein n=1 Tax=Streptomyces sp. NPDC001339 TaxID=3364563 RepID=UPI00368B3E94